MGTRRYGKGTRTEAERLAEVADHGGDSTGEGARAQAQVEKDPKPAQEELTLMNVQLTDDQRLRLEVFVARLLTLHNLDVGLHEDKRMVYHHQSFYYTYGTGPMEANVVNSGWFGKFIRQFEIVVTPWKNREEDGSIYRFAGAELQVSYDHGNLGSNGSNGVSTVIYWDREAKDWVHLTRDELSRLQRKIM